jgi:hypothetical protein
VSFNTLLIRLIFTPEMEALTHTFYEAYFRYLTGQHPSLQGGGEDMFGIIDIEDAFGSFRSKVQANGYFFRLIRYVYRAGRPAGEHNMKKYLQGGWVIGKMVNTRSITAEGREALLSQLERINDDFIDRMVLDSQNGHPLFLQSLDDDQDFSSQPYLYTADGSYIAWRTVYSWEHFLPNCLTHDGATAWLDGGNTPHEFD